MKTPVWEGKNGSCGANPKDERIAFGANRIAQPKMQLWMAMNATNQRAAPDG